MTTETLNIPDLETLRSAHDRIQPFAHRTPVLTSSYLDERFGAQLFFKAENFQKVGAFKFRGATNAVFSLAEEEAARGVVTHSSGNHAQALALAARNRGIPAWVVMPKNAPAVKKAAVRDYGAEVVLCEPSLEARESETARVQKETGATLIHPFNDPRIIAGQATAALELMEQVEAPLDRILTPVGGGGLCSGAALAAHYLSPATRVMGVEPKAADDAYRSLQEGTIQPSIHPQTLADGLLTSLGPLTFAILRRHVEIVTVSEEAMVEAMRTVWERMKIVIEPSAAVPLAALFEGALDVHDQRVGIILSGGNVDLARLPWSADHP
jgi:threonine dehydratase